MWTPAKLVWTVVGVLLVLATSSTAPAQNIVFGSFNASFDTGSLAGTIFPVSYSYDADQVNELGDSFVQLNSFDFTLLGVSFMKSDIFQGGQAIFRDGALENVTASFQVLLAPNSPVKNITFGFGGPGVIGYVDVDNQFGSGSFRMLSEPPAGVLSELYGLEPGSTFSRGCFPPCLCPIFSTGEIRGTYLLTFDHFDPLFDYYVIDRVDWIVTIRGEEVRITGSGAYRIGGEFARQHQLTLALRIGNDSLELFDSGLILGGAGFPNMINIDVSIRGMRCFDTVIEMRSSLRKNSEEFLQSDQPSGSLLYPASEFNQRTVECGANR